MNHPHRLYLLFALIAVLLSACAPQAPGLSQADQIATMVAGTLAAQGEPAATGAPTEEGEPQDLFGACANSGQLSLVYVKDGNIWLWLEGAAETQLTSSGEVNDVRISQDGCRIAYARAVPNPNYDPNVEIPTDPTFDELWVISSDGSGDQKLAGAEFFATLPQPEGNPGLTLYQFEWQPGAHTLAFSTEVLGYGLIPSNDIHLVDADSQTTTTVLDGGQGGWFAFSHDGQQLAFSTPTSINAINTNGTNPRLNLLTFPGVITYSEYAYYPPLHWNPSDDTIMVAIPPEDGLSITVENAPLGTSLWVVPVDGGPPLEAVSVLAAWFAFHEVQYSPDTSRIAYLRPVGDLDSNQRELVIALNDGSDESVPLLLPEVTFEAWSPDNNQYIYSYRDPAFHLLLGSGDSPNVSPISGLTPFAAGGAVIVWVEGSTFVQLLQGDAGAELSVMYTSGAGMVVENFADFFAPFDVAH